MVSIKTIEALGLLACTITQQSMNTIFLKFEQNMEVGDHKIPENAVNINNQDHHFQRKSALNNGVPVIMTG